MRRSQRLVWGLVIGLQLVCAERLLGQAVDVSVNPASQSVNVGDPVSIEIRLNTNAQSVCTGGIFLQFDSARLNFVNGANNTATWNLSIFNVEPAQNEPGIISLNVGAASPVTGSSLLVSTLNFTATAVGTGALDLLFNAGREETQFFAANCTTALTTNRINGSVTIQIPPCAPGAPDSDGDGICDSHDNCPFAANPGQEDIGGIGATSGPDGIGDACQCGDVNANGRVTIGDSVIVLRSLLMPPSATQTKPDLCDVGGSAGCSIADSVIILRANLNPPTTSVLQHCAPANP